MNPLLDRDNDPEAHKRFNILGVGVSATNLAAATSTICSRIDRREKSYVTVTGVHGIMESQRDKGLLAIHNHAGLVTPDGMPLVWLMKLRGHRHVGRVYGPDLMMQLCRDSLERGYRHFLYGSSPSTLDRLRANLLDVLPSLDIVGVFSPPFRPLTPDEDNTVTAMINAASPDIVWVGLSTPKQERWMAAHSDQLNATMLIGVGAAFDFHAGVKRQAPRWMQQASLEWLFRLANEPRRLAGRYLRNNPTFLVLIAAQLLGLKKYDDTW